MCQEGSLHHGPAQPTILLIKPLYTVAMTTMWLAAARMAAAAGPHSTAASTAAQARTLLKDLRAVERQLAARPSCCRKCSLLPQRPILLHDTHHILGQALLRLSYPCQARLLACLSSSTKTCRTGATVCCTLRRACSIPCMHHRRFRHACDSRHSSAQHGTALHCVGPGTALHACPGG